ncbi:hypothetical protein HUJ04_000328 [Dendroctonus ponderosae]|nr:hypothetical protein HUJ04_000328 [Dendroctonus ponderosae]
MTYEAILVAVLAIVITIVVFLVRRLLSSGKRYVLLTGLNDTGKTLIYSQLVYNRHVATFTSSQDNEGQFNTQKQNFVTLVDLPGFHSIRQQFFEKYKAASKGIVYVVDSVTLAQNVRDAANVLYNILIDPTPSEARNPRLTNHVEERFTNCTHGRSIKPGMFVKWALISQLNSDAKSSEKKPENLAGFGICGRLTDWRMRP